MKDGLYDLRFVALNTVHEGKAIVRGNLVDGGDAIHAVRGQLSRAGANMLASFEVHRRGFAQGSDEQAHGYTMKMFGYGTETSFNVIGIGPLGLIVELLGIWRAASPDGGSEADIASMQ